jgi:hypothetical protein
VKVLDFGLAKLLEPSEAEGSATMTLEPAPRTEEGTIVGTVAYMSPEQAEGKKVDARSDIFSFGSVLYEMVTGRRALQEDSKLSTLTALLHREPEPLGAEAPHDLQKLITRCLRKDPARRFQHMEDLKVALEELKEESDSGTLAGPAAPRAPARRFSPALLMAVVAAMALGAAAWLWFRRSAPAPPEAALTAVPLTSYPCEENEPSFSPDGTQVAFAWRRERDTDIYIKQIGVEEPFPDEQPGGGNQPRLVTGRRLYRICPRLVRGKVRPGRHSPAGRAGTRGERVLLTAAPRQDECSLGSRLDTRRQIVGGKRQRKPARTIRTVCHLSRYRRKAPTDVATGQLRRLLASRLSRRPHPHL